MLKRCLLAATAGVFACVAADRLAEIRLWPGGASGSEGKTAPETVETSQSGDERVSSIHNPSIMKKP